MASKTKFVPKECLYCDGYVSKSAEEALVHYRTHEKNNAESKMLEKKYACPVCSKCYAYQAVMVKHVRKKHKDVQYDQKANTAVLKAGNSTSPKCSETNELSAVMKASLESALQFHVKTVEKLKAELEEHEALVEHLSGDIKQHEKEISTLEAAL